MPDEDDIMRESSSLAAALAALPLETPAPGGFARVEASLARRRARRRLVGVFALAASLAVVALVPLALVRRSAAPEIVPPVVATRDADADADADALRALIEQNQQLEAYVRAQDEPYDGATAYASAGLEDLIGLVDGELAATDDRSAQDSLWRQRRALLTELVSVRSQGVTRLATNDAALLPASWRLD